MDSADAQRSIDEARAQLARDITDIGLYGATSHVRHVKEHMPDVIQHMDDYRQGNARAIGFDIGYSNMRTIYPARPGEMSVVGARPSVGKTAFAANCCQHIAGSGVPCAFFSAEMSARNFLLRLLCGHASVSMADLGKLGSHDMRRISEGANKIAGMPIWLEDQGNIRADDIAARLYELKRDHNIGAAWVDYLQFIRPPRRNERYGNREAEVAAISNTLKNAAKELDIHICVLAQLNRDADKSKPRISHLRESGAIEQDADVICLLHREIDGTNKEKAQAIVGKHRNGPTGIAHLRYVGVQCRFYVEERRDNDEDDRDRAL